MKYKIYYSSDEAKDALIAAGLDSFDKFWNIEETLAESFGIESLRTHNKGKRVLRDTCKFNINGKRYFLKRACGRSFKVVEYELEARSVLPKFGLTSSKYSAWCIDKSSRRAFILLDDLTGYTPFDQIVEENAVETFKQEKESFFGQVIAAFKMIQASPYMYRDWDCNHLFFNSETRSVALIDLERFMHISNFPIHYRLPMVQRHKRRKERKKLAAALGMNLPDLEEFLAQ